MKSRDIYMKPRKAFELRSDYVQITFTLRSPYVRLVQKLRNFYVKKPGFFSAFLGFIDFF